MVNKWVKKYFLATNLTYTFISAGIKLYSINRPNAGKLVRI